ncbi:hypothetical protein KHP62_21095 [Rhodobacteraceae bacterium NNCM2]|nr:hypothetical protein [Coraliihabitans acroporae]
MRLILVAGLILALTIVAYLSVDMTALTAWAAEQQRGFQNQMASAVRALRAGDPGAYSALLAAAGAYGFAHAVGPGHGKYLIGGVGLGSSVSVAKLLGVAVASSLAQALWAIVLVYGGFFLLDASASRMTGLAENYLAPASYLAIAGIGAVLIWRGARALMRSAAAGQGHDHHHHDHDHGDAECGCHAHGPTPEEVAKLGSLRDALLLIGSIAMRPCTGAIFLLVIAWQMGIQTAGAAAVVVMGLGTAGLTSLVAVSSVAARGVTFASAAQVGVVSNLLPILQMVAGLLIVWGSLLLLGYAIR